MRCVSQRSGKRPQFSAGYRLSDILLQRVQLYQNTNDPARQVEHFYTFQTYQTHLEKIREHL